MNKTVIIILVLVLLGGLGYFLISNQSQKAEEAKMAQEKAAMKAKEEAVMKEKEAMKKDAGEGSEDVMMKKTEDKMMEGYKGKVLAGKSAPLLDFQKSDSDYDNALKSDKLIVLYFYANWCPICRVEVPKLYEAFNELTTDKVIGFRINYNDSDTDQDEVALAKEFGVAYQHTKVFIKNGKRILKSPESWNNKQRYLDEIDKALK